MRKNKKISHKQLRSIQIPTINLVLHLLTLLSHNFFSSTASHVFLLLRLYFLGYFVGGGI